MLTYLLTYCLWLVRAGPAFLPASLSEVCCDRSLSRYDLRISVACCCRSGLPRHDHPPSQPASPAIQPARSVGRRTTPIDQKAAPIPPATAAAAAAASASDRRRRCRCLSGGPGVPVRPSVGRYIRWFISEAEATQRPHRRSSSVLWQRRKIRHRRQSSPSQRPLVFVVI